MAHPPYGRNRCPIRRLALLTTVALAVRLLFCAATTGLGQLPGAEYREYLTLGRELLDHGAFANALTPDAVTPQPTAMYPPVYALVVRAAFAAWGADTTASVAALQCLNALCTALLAPLAWDILRRFGAPIRWAWGGAVLIAAHPLLISLTPRVWDTALFALGATAAVWLILLAAQRRPVVSKPAQDRSHRPSDPSCRAPDDEACYTQRTVVSLISMTLGYGAYLGALAHINPAMTPCYPLLTLWLIRRTNPARSWRTPTVGVCCALIGWAAVSLPWTLRNHRALGAWTYVRSGAWQEVWFGCCPEAESGFAAVLNANMPLRNASMRQRFIDMGEAAYVRACKEQSIAAIEGDPSRYLRLCLRRASDYWLGTTFSLLGNSSPILPPTASRRGVMLFLTLETLAFAIAVGVARRRSGDVAWLAGVVIVFSLTYALTHVETRYRAPIEPLLVLVIVMGAALCRAADAEPDPPRANVPPP